MNEKLNKVQKSLELFRKMLLENSKEYREGVREYRELTTNPEWKEEYNSNFKEVKEILSDISKGDDEESFITYLGKFGSGPWNLGKEELNWKEHTNIVKKSDNYLKYFEELKKGCVKIKSSYRTVFDLNKLNTFCSSIIAEVA